MEEITESEAVECNQSNSVAIDVDDAGNHGIDVAATVDDVTESMKKELASKFYKPDYSATILRVPEEDVEGYQRDSVEEDVDDAGSDGNGWVATVDDLTKSMKDELASKPYKPADRATILRVPDEMRNDDPGAYIPKVVSIGPFHRSGQNVQHMEELKWHYLGKFLDRKPKIGLQMYVQKMKEIESQARSCYEGNIEMESEEFVKMMVLDGCFIIQLLLQLEDDLFCEREDPIYRVIWTLPRVAHDMLLLENQLPFCVLEELWFLTGRCAYKIRSSILNFFCNLLPEEHDHEPSAIDVHHHILHLLHSSLIETAPDHPNEKFDPRDRWPPPVSNYGPPPPEGSGSPDWSTSSTNRPHTPSPVESPHPISSIKKKKKIWGMWHSLIGPNRGSSSQPDPKAEILPPDRGPPPVPKPEPDELKAELRPHDRRSPLMSKHKPPPPPPPPPKTIPTVTELQEAGVKFKRKKTRCFLEIKFKQGLMEIPRLTISDSTNSLFRNFIAFEQCLPWSSAHFTSYCIFMDSLINTPRDVQLLYQSDIIEHVLGSDKEVAILFNKLCKGITWDFKNSYLANVSEGVIQHSQLKWPKWRAKLVRDYFSNPWAILSLAAAIFVIILASGQTFFAFFAYFRPPRS